ncbi:unnamed protein product [Microthlaspi erraticum]|uniref:Uncharacterized protein n=1 Tax=Microthlaspi erraticum TaxID=1685480 RepID=A0A6D2J836_9BRAS|nr:unnamed protein product [Microthlaspi erraticum]
MSDSSTKEETIHKPHCKRNVSGELDVFEATQYFSDFNESTTIAYSRIQIQKQTIATEHRQNRVHPVTRVVLKPHEKEMTRGGGGKLAGFLNSLLRSAGLKKSKSKLTPEVETPRGERRRRNSCVVVTTQAAGASPIPGAGVWRLNARRRSFDEKQVKDSKNLNIRFCESIWLDQKVECKDRNAGIDDVNGGCEITDSSSESDLFELDLFAKSNP